MISGFVSSRRQPTARLVVRGPQGQEQTVEALLDTGYNGTLVLPSVVVRALNLPKRRTPVQISLGNDSVVVVETSDGRVLWDGIERPIRVISMGDQAVVGLALLYGYRLCIEVVKTALSKCRCSPDMQRPRRGHPWRGPVASASRYLPWKSMLAELMQNRWPVGMSGASSKTCPRCPPQRRHVTSTRCIPNERSSCSSTRSGSIAI